MEVLDSKRMRDADRHAILECGLPGLVLMENAGRLVAETIADELGELVEREVVIVAGPGNNGGDGFVVARHLAALGADVAVLIVGRSVADLDGDAAIMATAWKGIGGEIVACLDAAAWADASERLLEADIVVDALFGTGLSRPAEGLPARAIASINEASAAGSVIVAVDLPSGLDASSADVPGPAVRADLTVSFARPKLPHLLPPAEDLSGDLVVVDIGIPDASIRRTAPDLHWVLPEEAALLLPAREIDDHKGSYGHVGVIAGAPGRAGAAALAGMAALRSGAGLVTVAAPGSVRGEVAAFAAELMTEELPASDDDGGLGREAGAEAMRRLASANVLAVGPGVGRSQETQAAVRALVGSAAVTVVLDADGLNAFETPGAAALAEREAPLIITPHPGEAARLAGLGTADVQDDRLGTARRLAASTDAICVLKGYRTIVAAPNGEAYVNPTGNPGLATAGSGDVLTGLIAGLVAQGLEPLEAAILGTYLHGMSADVAVATGASEQSLVAGDVLDHLADALGLLVGCITEDEDVDAP